MKISPLDNKLLFLWNVSTELLDNHQNIHNKYKIKGSMDCIFCSIISDPSQALVVYEDNDFLAFLDINPINEGHTLLIPKKHTQFIWDMEQNDYTQIFETGKIIQEKLQKIFNPKAVGLAIEGLTVPHTHIHFVPLNNMGELNPMRAKRATKEQLLATFQKITQS